MQPTLWHEGRVTRQRRHPVQGPLVRQETAFGQIVALGVVREGTRPQGVAQTDPVATVALNDFSDHHWNVTTDRYHFPA
jgi:hypothetical protein